MSGEPLSPDTRSAYERLRAGGWYQPDAERMHRLGPTAGSVVTKDVPTHVLALRHPARVVRKLV